MPRGGKRPGAGRKKGSTKPPIPRLPSSQVQTPSIVRVLEMMLERRGKFSREDMELIRQAAVGGWLHFTDEDSAAMVAMIRKAEKAAGSVKEMVAVAKTYAALRMVNLRELEAVLELIAEKAEDAATIEQHAHLHLHADAESQRARLDAIAERLGIGRTVDADPSGASQAGDGATAGKIVNGSAHPHGTNGKAGSIFGA